MSYTKSNDYCEAGTGVIPIREDKKTKYEIIFTQ
jgi:hypothetical protein